MSVTVVILTANEERHIERAISSVADFADHCIVVDSGSTDRTVEFAEAVGAQILSHPFVTQAAQFNWSLDQLPANTDWVLRLDADEFITPALADEISNKLDRLGPDIDGVYVSRRMIFLGRAIRWGGVFPIRVLRLFRYGKGRCEDRWMDEHIIVNGRAADFDGEIIDDNLNSLTWWTAKHNSYASREVVDLLNHEYHFMRHDTAANLEVRQQIGLKRWLKDNVYIRLPIGLRAVLYFFYRYVLRLGFLDGYEGTAFHVLQGCWYRFLVDAKLHEVRQYMRKHEVNAVTAIDRVLGIKIE